MADAQLEKFEATKLSSEIHFALGLLAQSDGPDSTQSPENSLLKCVSFEALNSNPFPTKEEEIDFAFTGSRSRDRSARS